MSELTPIAPATARRRAPMSDRRRGWWWAGCAALLVLIYLTIWTVYSAAHLTDRPRYVQLEPGVAARQFHADFRLLSLVQTQELTAESGASQIATVGAVWVVANVEVTQVEQDPDFLCVVRLLGPGGRSWEPARLTVSRSGNFFCSSDDLVLGRPYSFAPVFEVPARYADEIRGVVVVQSRDTSALPVLTPPG